MSMAIEKIDLLMERARIGYKEARDTLEQFDGNVVEALVYLESSQKTTKYHHKRYAQQSASILSKMSDSIAQMHATRFTLASSVRKILDLPLTVAILSLLIALPLSVPLLVIALLSGYKMTIIQPSGKKVKFTESANESGNQPVKATSVDVEK